MSSDPVGELDRRAPRPAWIDVDVAEAVDARLRDEAGRVPAGMVWAAAPAAAVLLWAGITAWGELGDPLLATVRLAGGGAP